MHLLEDIALLDLIRKDDRKAFTTIYDRYWDRLYASAFYHLKNTAAAEEIEALSAVREIDHIKLVPYEGASLCRGGLFL